MTKEKAMNTEGLIKDYLRQMATQDNRGTAFPYYYVIKDFKLEQVPSGFGGDIMYSWLDSEGFMSEEDLEEYRKDYEEDPDELEEIEVKSVEYTVEGRIFLTENDAETHLECNNYHYSKKAYTYVCHLWRCNDFEDFLKSLFEHFEIDRELLNKQ